MKWASFAKAGTAEIRHRGCRIPASQRPLRGRASQRRLLAIGFAALGGGCVIGNNTEATPVQFEAGTPSPVGFLPGVIVHEVCIAVDTDGGYVRPVALVANGPGDSIGPVAGAPVQPLPIDGVECPTDELYQGWARIEWRTGLGRAVATFEHSNAPLPVGSGEQLDGDADAGVAPDADITFAPAPSAASAGEVVLEGERFAGYDVTSGEPDYAASGIVTLPLDVGYRAAGTLAGRPADNVALALSYVPIDLTVFGTSTGGDGVRTDFEGHVDVLYRGDQLDCFTAEEFGVYVTPPNGGTTLAASLFCTTFEPPPKKPK
jgi:hypothetical protein